MLAPDMAFSLARLSVFGLLLAAAGPTACGESCPVSVEAYCATLAKGCPKSWAAAQDPKSWTCATTVILSTCGDVRVATVPGADASTRFYFDAAGGLHRVESFSATDGQQCLGGAGDTPTCSDPAEVTLTCTP